MQAPTRNQRSRRIQTRFGQLELFLFALALLMPNCCFGFRHVIDAAMEITVYVLVLR
jgi:hypothetical protein